MASPVSLLEWDTEAVQSWLVKLGFGRYEDAIYEHGITGEVLALLDHATLLDMGIESIGHRLGMLRAVWDLKRAQGMPISPDEWQPSDDPAEQTAAKEDRAGMERLWALVAEQHERIHMLETQHIQLQHLLEDQGLAAIPSTPIQPGHMPSDLARVAASSPSALRRAGSLNSRWRGQSTDSDSVASGSTAKASRRSSSVFPPSQVQTSNTPQTGLSDHFNGSFTPTTNTPPYPFESPSGPSQATKRPHPPPLVRLMSNSSLIGAPGTLQSPSPTGQALNTQQMETSSNVSSQHPASEDKEDKTDKSVAKAAKSFKVTLEDPTFKVLPAALKKYKRGEDWRQYAMFICFGDVVRTERCLAYDEKPLLLFQKLKESGQKPMFMLRHIREIKSPIAVAQQKHASKTSKAAESKPQPNEPSSNLSFGNDDAQSPTTSVHPYGSGSTRLHHPPVLQPVSAKAQQAQKSAQQGYPDLPSPGMKDGESQGQMSAAAMLKLLDGNDNKPLSYAIAIYPYYADREDEFDVEVGATFIILAKDKTWWIVQKDADGMGMVKPDVTKSGWVPSGCLLETKDPITTVVANSPTAASHPNPNAPAGPPRTSRQPILPTAIVSSSYPGIALMDYDARSEDELHMLKGDELRVFKKYNHWSYCVKTNNGERGWVPAWFIGKQSADGATASTPVTAAPVSEREENESARAADGGN